MVISGAVDTVSFGGLITLRGGGGGDVSCLARRRNYSRGAIAFPRYPRRKKLLRFYSALKTRFMEQIQAEVAALNSQIEILLEERAALTINNVISSENDSPQAMVEAYRRQARENAQLSVELQGIDAAIAALEVQIKQKQNKLVRWQVESKQLTQQQQLEEAKEVAQVHAQRINQLAGELAAEVRFLKLVPMN